jgi:hypothetical protein
MISEDEVVETRVKIEIGGEVLKLSSYFGSKNWNPDKSSCKKSGNTVTCISNEIGADVSGTSQDPGEERAVCSEAFIEVSDSEDAKQILIQLKSNHWLTNGHETCKMAKERGEPSVTKKVAKFQSLTN